MLETLLERPAHPLDGGTFDLIDEVQGVIRMTLVNVCHACRMAETGLRIMKAMEE